MSWFKSILLLSVLGMTWAECDRHPAVQNWSVPDALLDTAPTNTIVMPVGARSRILSNARGRDGDSEGEGHGVSLRMARATEKAR